MVYTLLLLPDFPNSPQPTLSVSQEARLRDSAGAYATSKLGWSPALGAFTLNNQLAITSTKMSAESAVGPAHRGWLLNSGSSRLTVPGVSPAFGLLPNSLHHNAAIKPKFPGNRPCKNALNPPVSQTGTQRTPWLLNPLRRRRRKGAGVSAASFQVALEDRGAAAPVWPPPEAIEHRDKRPLGG